MAKWFVCVLGFLGLCWQVGCEDSKYDKMLLGLPRYCSASEMFAKARVDGFHAIVRMRVASLERRVRGSPNGLLATVAVRFDGPFLKHWNAMQFRSFTLMRITPQMEEHLKALASIPSGYEDEMQFRSFTLMRITPQTEEHLKALASIPSGYEDEVDILKRSHGLNDTTDLLVAPAPLALLQNFTSKIGMPVEVKHYYGRSFEPLERAPRRRLLRGLNVYGYNSHDAMNTFIESLPARFPQLVTVQNMGKSYEGRKMLLVKISTNPEAGNPIIFIDAGIHAREWAAPAMAMYTIHRLTNDPEARNRELRGVDWHILPLVNPDGYEYSRSSRAARLWRKTRSAFGKCFGVDGNRNYGFKWGVSGVGKNPCDGETYPGPKPFSEVETQIVRNIMMENAKRIKLYLSLHSYGQYLVYPWGFTGNSLPKQWRKLDELARTVSNAVQRAGGRPFKVLSAGQWYPAAGGSDDYAFGAVGIPYSYTMELTEGFEFTFPQELLPSVLPKFYEGFKTFSDEIKKEFGTS